MDTNDINDFLRTFKILTYKHNQWEVWQDYISLCACSISNAVAKNNYNEREKEYLSIIRKYEKSEQRLFPKLFAKLVMALEKNPEQDFLGTIFMQLDLGNHYKGQFFTPYEVCRLMAMSIIGAFNKNKEFNSLNDPCCGAGATLIAGANVANEVYRKDGKNFQDYILFVGQDIDRVVALMCYIQLSLLGCAGYIKIGNSLSEPVAYGDDIKNYWFTPMYFSKVWTMRRALHRMDILMMKKLKE